MISTDHRPLGHIMKDLQIVKEKIRISRSREKELLTELSELNDATKEAIDYHVYN